MNEQQEQGQGQQGQGWLRGAIILGAAIATSIYALSRSGNKPVAGAANTTAGAVGGAVQGIASSPIARSGGRLAEQLVGNVADSALDGVKGALKDILRQLNELVDQI